MELTFTAMKREMGKEFSVWAGEPSEICSIKSSVSSILSLRSQLIIKMEMQKDSWIHEWQELSYHLVRKSWQRSQRTNTKGSRLFLEEDPATTSEEKPVVRRRTKREWRFGCQVESVWEEGVILKVSDMAGRLRLSWKQNWPLDLATWRWSW